MKLGNKGKGNIVVAMANLDGSLDKIETFVLSFLYFVRPVYVVGPSCV